MKHESLTSQRFWHEMDRISESSMAEIEKELTARAVVEFGLDLRCMLFDATNFFTFVDSFNERATLPQRGHSKEGRAALRIVGLALAVTSDGDVPLFHHCYAGNQNDTKMFSSVVDSLASRCRQLTSKAEDITLVFDKGNNSAHNLASIEQHHLHFVGSLVPTHWPDLLAIPLKDLRPLNAAQFPDVRAKRVEREVFGFTRTVLVTWNRKLLQAQTRTLEREIAKRHVHLQEIEDMVARHRVGDARGRAPTAESIQKRVDLVIAARHMRELFDVKIASDKKGVKIRWRFQKRVWNTLQKTLLGRTILFTSRSGWTDEQIVYGYRSQYRVESAFRSLKDPHCLSFRPTYHWTDHKLRVHALICVVALMILSLLRRRLAETGHALSIRAMLETLDGIRESRLAYRGSGQRAETHTVLNTLNATQRACFDALDLGRMRAA
jgi:transposase